MHITLEGPLHTPPNPERRALSPRSSSLARSLLALASLTGVGPPSSKIDEERHGAAI